MGKQDGLSFAHTLADAADVITMGHFKSRDLRVETKADLTPASEADTGAEAAIRELVRTSGRGEGVVGEEFGDDECDACWIVDPIDGTKNYVRGMPVWATLLALQRDGVVECALVSAPALGRRWWAARDGGAFVDGKRCHVSRIARIEDAYISTVSRHGAPGELAELIDRAWSAQSLGGFWQHCLVAEGVLDIACQPEPRLWDYVAPTLIVEEAGGRATTFSGARPAEYEPYLTTNGILHDEVVRMLSN